MTPPTKLTSLLAKLRNEARKRGLPANLMLLFYFQERFLARVSDSRYRDQFILKGGLNLYGRYGNEARPTRDIDLAAQQLPHTVEAVRQAITTIAQQDLKDGILFDTTDLKANEIIEAATYKGVRVELIARFDDASETLQLDVSFGNAITPAPIELSFPSLLGGEPHSLLAYPLETMVAEKLAAAIEIGEGNTRLKDFYDLYWIVEHELIDQASLSRALERTFKARGTPRDRREALELLNSQRAQEAWSAFLKRSPVEAPARFAEVLERILAKVGRLLEN